MTHALHAILTAALAAGCVFLAWLYVCLAQDYARLDSTADGLRRERDRLAQDYARLDNTADRLRRERDRFEEELKRAADRR